jgi:hypothetical protein
VLRRSANNPAALLSTLLSLFGCLVPFSAIAQVAVKPTSHVRLIVVDEEGRAVPYRVVEFVSVGGQDFRSRFTGLSAEGIPLGTYKFLLERSDMSANGVGEFGDTLVVSHASVLKTILLAGALEGNPSVQREYAWAFSGFSRRGTIGPVPTATAPLHLRLSSVYGERNYEAEVSSRGEFTLYDAVSGDYVAMLFAGDRLACVRFIRISGFLSLGRPDRSPLQVTGCAPPQW